MPLLTTMAGCPASVLGGGATGLSGVAKDELNAGIGNAAINLLNGSFSVLNSTTTNGSGAFNFAAATSGNPRYLSIAGPYNNYGPFTLTVPQDLGNITFTGLA
jgi:hypothetical protein